MYRIAMAHIFWVKTIFSRTGSASKVFDDPSGKVLTVVIPAVIGIVAALFFLVTLIVLILTWSDSSLRDQLVA